MDSRMLQPSLVIGIGNPLRGDDGVGWHLAEALGPPHRAFHQLTPECAAVLAGCRRVLFVDAWCGESASAEPLLRPLVCAAAGGVAPRESAFTHQLHPAALLAISDRLYGHRPEAWELLVPASRRDHGEAFSPQLQARLPRARALVQQWLEEALCTS